MRALTLARSVFYVIYDLASGQFYHYRGTDEFNGEYVLGPINEASRFATMDAAVVQAECGVSGPYEIRKCSSLAWKMS